jgi:hypothetical protein
MSTCTARALAALAAVALLLAACGGDDDDNEQAAGTTVATDGVGDPAEPTVTTVPTDDATTTTAAPATTTTTTGATTTTAGDDDTTTTTAAPDGDAPALDDGRHFGFISAVDLDARTVTFDLAQWLSGEEANAAAEADGAIEPGEGVPNDYYIVNDNPRLRVVPLSFDVGVLLVDWPNCCESVGATLDDVVAAIDADGEITAAGFRYYPGETGYWLTIDGGEIVSIEEQYRP